MRVPVAVRMHRLRFRRNLDDGNLELRTISRPIGVVGHKIVGARLGMMKRRIHDAWLDALSNLRSKARLATAPPHLEPISVTDAAQFSVARMYLEAILRVHASIRRASRLSTNIVLT